MPRKRTTVLELAREAAMDLDEALIALWDAGFDSVTGPSDILGRGEANRARRALGLATRRELGSSDYWQQLLKVDRPGLEALLFELGVPKPFDDGRLRKRAIHRLKAEGTRRGVPPPASLEYTPPPEADPVYPPFTWGIVGHERDVRHITASQVEAIHNALVADFRNTPDPIDPPGIRSRALLESAINRPETSNGNARKYPTVEMAAAALLHALVHNHPFHNGNKRTALVSVLVFLDENGLIMTCDENALFKILLQLAQHALVLGPRQEIADRETLAVANWVASCVRRVEKGDRAVPWRRLRQILSAYGCEYEFPTGAGNRINISRRVCKTGGLFGRPRSVVLRTQTFYGDEGREMQNSTIKKIRHDLELDDEHGVDSRAFYDEAAASLSTFIITYRKTLRRLARV